MALQIFPPEVWQLVMLELQESADILNVFKAFPELEREGILRKTRVVWQFGQIFPIVFPRLGNAEILSCRQVCRNWLRTVDNFLENHPQRRAYSHDDPQVTGQLRIFQASPEHYYLDQHFRGNVFSSRATFTDFIQKMSEHPPGRNPFIGGYVKIEKKGDCDSSPSLEMFWDHCALEFVQKFGEHILFLEVEFCLPWGDSEVPLEMLRCLPNLRGLTMSLPNEYDFSSRPETVPTSPFLPYLETLKLDAFVSPENLDQLFIPQHFANIRKLSIARRSWRKEYSNLFPKLTELTILDMTTKDELTELFQSLNAPGLCKLTVKSSPRRHPLSPLATRSRRSPPIPFDEDVVSWLKRFPLLSSFKFTMSRIGPGKLTVTRDIASFQSVSLTSLTLTGKFAPSVGDLSMLRYFPRLEYFKVTGGNGKEQLDDNVLFCKLDGRSVYESDVWDFLPKLKWISFGSSESSGTVRYSRARWEYLKKTKTNCGIYG